jgi:cell division protein FtsQ
MMTSIQDWWFSKVWDDETVMDTLTKALLSLLVLILALASLWWAITRPMFSFSQILIEGADGKEIVNVNAPTVRGTAVRQIQGNFFTADLQQVRDMFEQVTWVRKASVRREWPNKLIVTVEEHVPLGLWGDDGRLLSDKGAVFVANIAEAELHGQMMEFSGPDGSEAEVVKRYAELQQWFAPIKLFPISVTASPLMSWSVKFHNGIVIQLGRDDAKENVKTRIDRLMTAYPDIASRLNGRIESVDLRYQSGFAVKASGLTFKPDTKKL